jgi:hypothetical protein
MEIQPKSFQCPVCLLRYADEDLAKQCEAWDSKHDGPNLELVKNALPPEDGDLGNF